MKRVIFSILGTVVGLVALLDFKSHGQATVGEAAGLPSASLPTSSTAATPAPTPTATTGPADPTATSAPSSTPDAPAAQPATYTGTAVRTRYGTVQVAATVANGKITNVTFVQLTDRDNRSAEINREAAPVLLRETLDAQSSNIDSVSGATFTSEGYIQSLQSALDQAGLQ